MEVVQMSNTATHRDLYDAIKQNFPSELKPYFNRKEIGKVDKDGKLIVPNNKVYCEFEGIGNYRMADGTIGTRTALLTMNLFTGRTDDDQLRGFDYSEQIVNKLDKITNKLMNINGKQLIIKNCKRVGDYKHMIEDSTQSNCFIIKYIIKFR
jgi:hypothetical protein